MLIVAVSGPAPAQEAARGATDPSKIQQRIERPRAPVGTVGPLPSPAPPRAVETGAPEKQFVLVGAEIVGASVYDAARLADFYEPYLGQSIGLAEIEKIVGAITEQYRKDGYFLSRAMAPPQDLEIGVLRIRVIEGFIEEVRFSGPKPGRAGLFDAWTRRITGERPARLPVLERTLLLMADTPGLVVHPSISETDPERGAFRLQLRLTHDAYAGFASLDNRGTTPVGPLQTYDGVSAHSLFGLLETTRLAVFTTPQAVEELRYVEFEQSHVINSVGTRGWVSVSASSVDTGDAGRPNKQNSRAKSLTLGVSQSVIRQRDHNLSGTVRLDVINSDSVTPDSRFDDRLRVLRVGADFNILDSFGGTSWASLYASKGLGILDASEDRAAQLSRTNGRSRFFKTRIDVGRTQALTDTWSLQVVGAAQATGHVLLSSEEFAVGGARFGRAYDPAEISGSKGAAASVELRYSPPFALPVATSWQLYGYYDIGAVWSSGVNRLSAASAGGGLRLALPYNITGDLLVAQPLTRPLSPGEGESGGPRLFFSVRARF